MIPMSVTFKQHILDTQRASHLVFWKRKLLQSLRNDLFKTVKVPYLNVSVALVMDWKTLESAVILPKVLQEEQGHFKTYS